MNHWTFSLERLDNDVIAVFLLALGSISKPPKLSGDESVGLVMTGKEIKSFWVWCEV